ncbi:MAG TPA: M42 family metallopeptidase [Anaerolineae bacterium]|nr:M42 family metallopeptidase [Anaerolineae bacterium]HOQ99896.1 M42 family metallopeptidase [Anaerolineae bacterium]
MDATEQLLKELTEAPGLPGYEGEARAVMRRALEGTAAEITQDGLGSLIATLPGSAERPRIMLAGHLDEVGFIVRFITENGFIRFLPLGGWWDQVLLAHQVVIKTRKGDVVGVIGAKPPHMLKEEERNKVVEKDAMYIDVGASSRAQVEELGVRVGDPIVPRTEFTVLAGGTTYLSKAWDNRVGCALVVAAFRALKGRPHANTLYGVGTVQEEVGLRGARTSAHAVDPDVGLVMEVAIAGDLPDMKPEEGATRLGGGVSLLAYDGSMIPNLKLRDLAIDTAQAAGIPYQIDLMPRGGTDGGPIHQNRSGVPGLVIGVPTRHIHSHQGIISRDDFDAAVRLVVALIERLDATTVAGLTP